MQTGVGDAVVGAGLGVEDPVLVGLAVTGAVVCTVLGGAVVPVAEG
jgi:hypothetical protein